MKWTKKATAKISETSYGFSMEKTPEDNKIYRGTVCMLKGFLIFCATFGTIGGLLNAFSIQYHLPAVFFTLLLLCFTLSFLHYNKLVFNVCYPTIFVLFTIAIFRNRVLANSGFQSFVSILYEAYSSYFELTSLRETNIANTNQYQTITVAAIFVGFVLALLLNIAISSYMSIFFTLLLTAPLLQIGIYIEKYPSPVYFIPLVFAYIAIGILGSFKHHLIPQKKKERIEYRLVKKGTNHYHIYQVNGKVLLHTTLLFAVVSLMFLLLFYPVALKSTNAGSAINNVKKSTDEYVKIFIQNGFSGFFNHYESTGGMSNGRLGGVSSVRPDFETDLIVTYAPYSYETVYLKGFVGIEYTGDSWTSSINTITAIPDIYEDEKKTDVYMDFTAFMEADRLKYYMDSDGQYALKGKMTIENVDANPGYVYLPYYTTRNSIYETVSGNSSMPDQSYQMNNHVITGIFPTRTRKTYVFYPAVSQLQDLTFPTVDAYADSFSSASDEMSYLSSYKDYCYDTYTYVPSNLIDPIKKVVNKTGFGSNTAEKVKLVEQYFLDNYSYSMSPGTTPRNEDFIQYFLTNQNQGYCAHFASAATMILRYMGVPARYVEGYVISASAISNSENTQEAYDDYILGTSPIGKTGVIQVEISDANAHAWVEVYSDGFGWVPVEVTPPSTDDENNYSDFFSTFTSLFSITPTSSQSSTTIPDTPEISVNDPLENFFASTDHVTLPLMMLLLLLLLFYPLQILVGKAVSYLRMKNSYAKGKYDKVAVYYYKKLFVAQHRKEREILRNFNKIPPSELTLPSQLAFDTKTYVTLLEKALYGKDSITKEEIEQLILWTKEAVNAFKKMN